MGLLRRVFGVWPSPPSTATLKVPGKLGAPLDTCCTQARTREAELKSPALSAEGQT